MNEPEASLPIKEILEAAEKLPPFPNVVRKVMPLIQNMAPVSEIEAVIMYDQAITAKVLAMARSPYYARRRNIGCMRDAIVALGEQQLLSVILAACSSRYFADESKAYDLKEGELWEHAVACALMTELVGRRLGWKSSLSAYTAALLHDIGKTVLSFHVGTYIDSIMAFVRKERMSFVQAERQVLGIDHQKLGALIARRWHFPKSVIAAIAYHHCPMEAEEHCDLASLVYIANRMVSATGIGCGVDGFLQPNEDKVFTRFGITARMVEMLLADFIEVMEETRQFLSAA